MKIISGGQTGADMGGLLAGRDLGYETGGTAPKGWRTELGANPALKDFGLVEHARADYPPRTIANIQDSDATVAVLWGSSVGTEMTICYALYKLWKRRNLDHLRSDLKHAWCYYSGFKPICVLLTREHDAAVSALRGFLIRLNVKTLNVAGHRESSKPGVQEWTREVLKSTFPCAR